MVPNPDRGGVWAVVLDYSERNWELPKQRRGQWFLTEYSMDKGTKIRESGISQEVSKNIKWARAQ